MHRKFHCDWRIHNKILSVLFCIIFSAAFLSSEFYISKETIHHCTGTECPICRILIICHVFLSTLSCNISGIVTVLAILHALKNDVLPDYLISIIQTPVTLKIKLSN